MILCLDIGGTAVKWALVPLENESFCPVHRGEFPTEAKILGGKGVQEKVLAFTEEYKASLKGVAVSTAGMVHSDTGEILYANENIPGYTGINLKTVLEKRFDFPVWVENDVRSAALGEYAYGAGRGCQSLLCITIGTGIGGALILEGKVHQGFSRSAGEIGYMRIKGEEFQNIASASALAQSIAQQTGQILTGKEIFQRVQEGDPLCQEALAELCDTIAQGAATALCVANPEMLVLGGGIMAQKTILQPLMKEALKKYMNEYFYKHTRFSFASLANEAGMAGAFYYWKQKEIYD